MATPFDVAAYIVERIGPTTHMKLQKLVYYAQAWSLVWDESPLFPESVQAWANGPVVPELFGRLKGKFKIAQADLLPGSSVNLTGGEKANIDLVLQYYGDKDPQWLSDLTHMESPWQAARAGLAPGERGDRDIPVASMAEYYGSL